MQKNIICVIYTIFRELHSLKALKNFGWAKEQS